MSLLKRILWISVLALLLSGLYFALQAQMAKTVASSLYTFGADSWGTRDTTKVVGAKSDTSKVFDIGGIDYLYLYLYLDNLADSLNVVTYLDISPDGINWVQWAAIDTGTVSGTADRTVYKNIISPLPPYGAHLGRLREVSASAATDSFKVTSRVTVTRIGISKLR